MEIRLSMEETRDAVGRFVSRDVLGVCGEGFKGETSVAFNAESEEFVVTITLPEHIEKDK